MVEHIAADVKLTQPTNTQGGEAVNYETPQNFQLPKKYIRNYSWHLEHMPVENYDFATSA